MGASLQIGRFGGVVRVQWALALTVYVQGVAWRTRCLHVRPSSPLTPRVNAHALAHVRGVARGATPSNSAFCRHVCVAGCVVHKENYEFTKEGSEAPDKERQAGKIQPSTTCSAWDLHFGLGASAIRI